MAKGVHLGSVPIITYHSIEKPLDEAGNELYCVPMEEFKAQMDIVNSKAKLTFDDGDITNYTYAYPVLKEKGMKAYFFILVSKVGEPGYMAWQQIKELRDAGMTIGSHGMMHRILTILSENELDYELKDSKKILEDNLQQPIEYLSLPRGFYDHKVIAKAKEAGYKAAFSSNPEDEDDFLHGRIAVKAYWNLAKFTKIVNNGLPFTETAEESIKNLAKKILGAEKYDKIRSKIIK